MALDTADKRDSAINHGLPWRMRFPAPDGSLDQGDRQHVAFVYRGIAAGDPGATPTLTGRWSDIERIRTDRTRQAIHADRGRIEVRG